MLSSKSFSLFWFTIEKFDDVIFSNELKIYASIMKEFKISEKSNGRFIDKNLNFLSSHPIKKEIDHRILHLSLKKVSIN